MDQIVLCRLVDELHAQLRDVRIESAYALPRYHLALPLGLPGSPRLWFAAEPDEPHLYLRPGGHASPDRPPGFAMALRKRCRGRRIAALRLIDEDRVAELTWHGDAARLVLELVPRRGAAYLVEQDGVVVAVWNPRRGRPGPGSRYTPPERRARAQLDALGPDDWSAIEAAPERSRPRELVRRVAGMSHLVARDALAVAAHGSPLERAAEGALARARSAATDPRIYSVAPLEALRRLPAPTKLVLAPYALESGNAMCELRFDSLSEAAAHYYGLRARLRFVDTLRSALGSQIRERRGRIERALARIALDPDAAATAERLRREGDLLLAHPDAVAEGDRVRLPDDYAGGVQIEIRVEPELDRVGNAQRRYARARRVERKFEADARRRRGLEAERDRLDALEDRAAAVSDLDDCDALVVEAERLGLVVRPDRLREPEAGAALAGTEPESKPVRRDPAGILSVRLRGGGEVLVGRNARANDMLTHELARRDDWWLHAEGPGSHVLLRNPGRDAMPRAQALEAAASLAAWFSKSRTATRVEVRWTTARNVRRAPGGRPGAALLDEYRSIRVRPRSPAEIAGKDG